MQRCAVYPNLVQQLLHLLLKLRGHDLARLELLLQSGALGDALRRQQDDRVTLARSARSVYLTCSWSSVAALRLSCSALTCCSCLLACSCSCWLNWNCCPESARASRTVRSRCNAVSCSRRSHCCKSEACRSHCARNSAFCEHSCCSCARKDCSAASPSLDRSCSLSRSTSASCRRCWRYCASLTYPISQPQ